MDWYRFVLPKAQAVQIVAGRPAQQPQAPAVPRLRGAPRDLGPRGPCCPRRSSGPCLRGPTRSACRGTAASTSRIPTRSGSGCSGPRRSCCRRRRGSQPASCGSGARSERRDDPAWPGHGPGQALRCRGPSARDLDEGRLRAGPRRAGPLAVLFVGSAPAGFDHAVLSIASAPDHVRHASSSRRSPAPAPGGRLLDRHGTVRNATSTDDAVGPGARHRVRHAGQRHRRGLRHAVVLDAWAGQVGDLSERPSGRSARS